MRAGHPTKFWIAEILGKNRLSGMSPDRLWRVSPHGREGPAIPGLWGHQSGATSDYGLRVPPPPSPYGDLPGQVTPRVQTVYLSVTLLYARCDATRVY
jgi:hypothetical protein